MNSQNVEMAQKIVIPSLFTIGGLWVSYFAYISFKTLYIYEKVKNYKPTNQMLEKAWEGFEYDPENNQFQQVVQVLLRSGKLNKKVMFEFTKFMMTLRQFNPENLNEFLLFVRQEIELKMGSSRDCVKYFLQYKNHSFEQFYQRNFQGQNAQIQQLISQYDFQQFWQIFDQLDRYYYPYDEKLPTINECIEYIKVIKPLMIEKKPQIDRLRNLIVQNGLDRFRLQFCMTYLSEQFQYVSNIQYKNFLYAIRYIKLDKIQLHRKAELDQLLKEYEQLMQSSIY